MVIVEINEAELCLSDDDASGCASLKKFLAVLPQEQRTC